MPAVLLGEWGFLNNLNDTSGNGHLASANWTPTYATGPQTSTRAIVINGATQSINYGRTGLEPTTGGIITMGWVKTNAFVAGYSSIFTRMRGSDSTRHTISIHDDHVFYMSRWKSRLQFADVAAATFTDHGWHHVCNIDADDRWAILIDGVQVAGSTDNQTANSEAAWETAYNWVSADNVDTSGRATSLDYLLSGVRMFQGTMTNAEAITWMNTPIVGGAISLTVANASQAETAGSPTLVRNINLTVQNANQAQTVGSPALTLTYALAPQGTNQGQAAESPVLTQVHSLAVQGANQGQSVGSPTLAQIHNLHSQNVDQAQSAGSPTLVQLHVLAVQNAQQDQVVGNAVLVVGGITLTIADARQSQGVSTPALAQVHFLNVQNAIQVQAVENVVYGVDVTLLVADAHQALTAQSVDLNSKIAPTAKERRLRIQAFLEQLLGSPHVYYQPPPNVKMQYPCIVYTRSFERSQFAANVPYIVTKRYTVTVIDRDPDSSIPDKVAALPMSAFQRFFTADNLNHDVFDLYF